MTREEQLVDPSLEVTFRAVRSSFQQDTHLIAGEVVINDQIKVGIVYLLGMIDESELNQSVITKLTDPLLTSTNSKRTPQLWTEYIHERMLSSIRVDRVNTIPQIVRIMLRGAALLLVEGSRTGLMIHVSTSVMRKIDRPQMDTSLMGSQEAFIESLVTNYMLIRRKLPTADLKFSSLEIGRYSHTEVRVCWLDGVADLSMKDVACRRLEQFNVEYVFTINMIAEFLEEHPLSIWPQYKLTERPDVVALHLTQGHIAILCDGSPLVVIYPQRILQEFDTIDDHAMKPLLASSYRLLRIFAFFIASMISSLYLSFVTYNHAIMPPDLALHISSSRGTVPFPSFIEMMLMTVVIDLLLEAGIRLPKALGSTISILGAVVIGQAAVNAGYVSPSLIIVISITAIAVITIPSVPLGRTARALNYAMLFLAALFGLFGVIIGFMLIVWQLCNLSSIGVNLISPSASGHLKSLADVLLRIPGWIFKKQSHPLLGGDHEKEGG